MRRWMPTAAAMLVLALPGCGSEEGSGPTPPPGEWSLRVAGGGHNVADRYTSDLWVHGGHAYTGTWGSRSGNPGNMVKIWRLDGAGAPVAAGSIEVPSIGTVSDVEVSGDGQVLLFSAEHGSNPGLYLYDLADPEQPLELDREIIASGIHTATFGEVDGRRYVFAARNPPSPALLVYDVTDPTAMAPASTVPVPPDYGIHDTFVRDGLAFVFAWNTGVVIYDVGGGGRGGSPATPVEVSRIVTAANGVPGGPAVHNGWWFHNPVTGERRYLFVGQEGPGIVGAQASGDIHVVDVSDLAHPREVASFRLPGAGTHNFWMDEGRQILFAAYYNAGVIALDVSGMLEGDLSARLLAQLPPAGEGESYTWGVQLANGRIYASDMLTGLWQLALDEPE